MPEMKNSGIEWIGEIPNDWSANKIKYVTQSRSSTYRLSNVGRYIGLENVESASGHFIETESEYEDRYYDGCEPGDLLYGKLRPNLAKVIISPWRACCTGEFEVISHSVIGKKYLQYFMLTDGFTQIVTGSTYGTKMPRANWDFIKNLSIVYPPEDIRNRIVAFLDSKCAEIDALSADIQSEIEMLEAFKRSVITEAVTKGLDKNVPMKDSGIDYVGVMPASWSVKRLKYVLKERNNRSETGLETLLSVSQYFGVIPSDSIQRTMQAKSLIGYKKVFPKDLVFNKLNPVLARFGVSTHTGITSPDFAVYYTDKADTRFLCYLLKTDAYIMEYGRLCTGVGDGFSRLYTPMLYNIKIAIPSLKKQCIIADYLDSTCAEIDAITAQKQEQLAVLADYKKSVIYEYVTGKKEVPV